MPDDSEELAPPKEQSLFPLRAEDILDNAFQNLEPHQAREVSKKAADEVLKMEVERRLAEQRGDAAHQEIKNIIESANLLDQTAGDYKINSTFQTASGTTNVEIHKGKLNPWTLIAIVVAFLVVLIVVIAVFLKT